MSVPAELRCVAELLAARVRVIASLVPSIESDVPSPDPLQLASTCVVNASGDGVSVVIALPAALPPGAGVWALHIHRIFLGSGVLDTRVFDEPYPLVVVPAPGPVRPAGALHAACKRGDLTVVLRILSGPSEGYSTEETDEASFFSRTSMLVEFVCRCFIR